MHAISTNTPMIDMSSSQISADTLSRQTHDHSGQRPLTSCRYCRHKHAVIGACSQRPADTCSRSYPVLASGASSRTSALQVHGRACSRKRALVADTCVMLRMDGCITTGNSLRKMSADEPHEGSSRHHCIHFMRDLRDHSIMEVHRR